MSIKLVAIDLDDTLLDSKLKITDKTKQVLREVRAKGINITLATGRMFALAVPFAMELGIDVPLITYQGALVKSSQAKEIFYSKTLPEKYAEQALKRIREYGFHLQMYLDDKIYMEKMTPEGKLYCEQLHVEPVMVEDLVALLSKGPIKILIIHNDVQRLADFEKTLQAELGHKLNIIRSKLNYLEIMDADAAKLKALKALADHLGVSREEVMAIGDSYTDLDIISWAGVGVAMANSIDDIVKQEADYITTSNDEDGVACALEKLVLKRGS